VSGVVRIGVIGAGGVGGYFGARYAAAGHDVSFLARGANLAALRQRGIVIRSPRGDLAMPVDATDDPDKIGPCDVVLLTVKGYALAAALPAAQAMLGPAGWVAVLLNGGPGPSERVAEVIGAGRTVAGAAYISCHLREPGVLEHHSPLAGVALGEMSDGAGERLAEFARASRPVGIDVDVVADVRVLLWTKFAFICGLAGATASTGHPIGDVRATASGREMLRGLVTEAAAVARAEGVGLPADYEAATLQLLDELDGGMRSSLYEDLAHGRPSELESLHGEILRRAARIGVAVPVTTTVHAVLAPRAAAAAART
jgi:2-dehydropantoate 2-reductase